MRIGDDSFSLANYMQISPADEDLLLLLHVTVAMALPETDLRSVRRLLDRNASTLDVAKFGPPKFDLESYIDSLDSKTSLWRSMLADQRQQGTRAQLRLLSLEACTYSPLLEPDELDSPRAIRRLDTIFDVLEVDWSAGEMRNLYLHAANSLSNDASTDWVPGAMRGARKVSDFLMMFHPMAGVAALAALSMVPQESNEDESGPPTLIRLVAACMIADEEDQEQKLRAARALSKLLIEIDSTSKRIASLGGRSSDASSNVSKLAKLLVIQRFQAKAAAALKVISGDHSRIEGNNLPSTVGQSLTEAKAVLGTLGAILDIVDAVKPNGTARTIWSDSNWYVSEQTLIYSSASVPSRVRLLVKKSGE